MKSSGAVRPVARRAVSVTTGRAGTARRAATEAGALTAGRVRTTAGRVLIFAGLPDRGTAGRRRAGMVRDRRGASAAKADPADPIAAGRVQADRSATTGGAVRHSAAATAATTAIRGISVTWLRRCRAGWCHSCRISAP